ncbi:MAG: hypothetical protein Q4C42_01485 [Clostridia bacterium]|nr:hypothetical protein [Clostridia bacterium]
MVDVIVEVLGEAADFFVNLWVDKIVNRITAKRKNGIKTKEKENEKT